MDYTANPDINNVGVGDGLDMDMVHDFGEGVGLDMRDLPVHEVDDMEDKHLGEWVFGAWGLPRRGEAELHLGFVQWEQLDELSPYQQTGPTSSWSNAPSNWQTKTITPIPRLVPLHRHSSSRWK